MLEAGPVKRALKMTGLTTSLGSLLDMGSLAHRRDLTTFAKILKKHYAIGFKSFGTIRKTGVVR
ncbi:hypothetical protein GCM10011361_00790 [Muriicola marianensis]|uniref:Uncharacterized protein n=1 Tax=Muriicola marianensis TaxID=1324801 RepID=A0ABQ1QQG1_9FLAO|nr:hypothetical protein GCM10011361_00790 [Muriicola marianensis]